MGKGGVQDMAEEEMGREKVKQIIRKELDKRSQEQLRI